jgi:hypothetical protein
MHTTSALKNRAPIDRARKSQSAMHNPRGVCALLIVDRLTVPVLLPGPFPLHHRLQPGGAFLVDGCVDDHPFVIAWA